MLSFRNKPIFFYSHTKLDSKDYDTRFLSNLYPCTFVLDETAKKYWTRSITCPDNLPSLEHAYQGLKPYDNEADAYFILSLQCSKDCEMCQNKLKTLSANDVAKFGQGRFIADSSQKKWLIYHKSIAHNKQKPKISQDNIKWLQNNCIDLMMSLLRCKFTKDNAMGKQLLYFADQYDEILFTEHTTNDSIWADAIDGSGTNFLGKLLTIRLKELLDDKYIDKLDYAYLNKQNVECVKYK